MPLQQIPAGWSATLEAVGADATLALYAHADAIIFDNSVTRVQLGLYDGDTVVAVKRTIRPVDEAELAKALREKDTLKALAHPHIVRSFSHAMDKSFIYVALEPFVALPLVAGQRATSLTLKHVVQQSSAGGPSIGRAARIDVLRQVADGLHYLHSNNLVHRDVKPMNVLVRPRPQGGGGSGGGGGFVAKLSDLEFAKELGSSSGGGAQASTFAGGTQDWQAPEVFMKQANTKGSDVFSLGLVVFFVCTDGGHALGEKCERTTNLMRIKFTGSAGHLTPLLAGAGPEAADLVGAMLVADPAARLGAGAVLAHPLFWTLGEKVRYVSRIHSSFARTAGLQAAVDGDGGGKGGCWGGGDWRLQEGLPAALWQRGAPGRFEHSDGHTSQYGNRTSELVRLVRNLSQHFAEQRPELRRAILEVGGGAGRGGGGGEAGAGGAVAVASSVDEQEAAAVGRCFFGAFPSLVVHLRRAEARLAQQQIVAASTFK